MIRRVVVTGLGVVSPVGIGVESFWDSIVEGRGGVDLITNFDVSKHSSKIAAQVKDFDPSNYMDRKEERRTDRFCQFAIAAASMAVEDSGLKIEDEDPTRIGVLIGSGIGGLSTIERDHTAMLEAGPRRISPFFIPMLIINIASGAVSMRYGLKGPNLASVTACATASHSIGGASKIIQNGEADVMVAGGAEAAVTPLGMGGFCAMKAMSTRNDEPSKASRPFDKERDGFVMGEGSGIVVIEELEHAANRGAHIYAEIIGYGMSADAYHITQPAPGGEGAVRSMVAAIKDAGISPSDVDYVNAHGTSTPLNDQAETAAVKTVFGEYAYKLAISSTKSMTGHLLGASGGVEMIVSVLAIRDNLLPPTINYEFPDPECDLDYVPNRARGGRVDTAMSNTFGFGGQNATLIVRRM